MKMHIWKIYTHLDVECRGHVNLRFVGLQRDSHHRLITVSIGQSLIAWCLLTGFADGVDAGNSVLALYGI